MYVRDRNGRRTQYRSRQSINQQLERMRNSPAFNQRRYLQAARIADAYRANIDYEQETGNLRVDDRIGDMTPSQQRRALNYARDNNVYPRSSYAYTEQAAKGNSNG